MRFIEDENSSKAAGDEEDDKREEKENEVREWKVEWRLEGKDVSSLERRKCGLVRDQEAQTDEDMLTDHIKVGLFFSLCTIFAVIVLPGFRICSS